MAEPQQQEGSSIGFFQSLKRKVLPRVKRTEPRKYEDYNRDIKSTLIGNQELIDGCVFSVQKSIRPPVGNDVDHESVFIHTFSFPTPGQEAMPEYSAGINLAYEGEPVVNGKPLPHKLNLFGRVDSNNIHLAHMKYNINPSMEVEASYNNANNMLSLEGEYTLNDGVFSARYNNANNAYALSYMQAVTSTVALGTSFNNNPTDRRSNVSFVARYKDYAANSANPSEPGKPLASVLDGITACCAEVSPSGVRAGLLHRVNERTNVGIDLNYHDRDLSCKFGIMTNFPDGRVRATIDPSPNGFHLTGVLEKRVSTGAISVTCDAQPEHNIFRFGFGLNMNC